MKADSTKSTDKKKSKESKEKHKKSSKKKKKKKESEEEKIDFDYLWKDKPFLYFSENKNDLQLFLEIVVPYIIKKERLKHLRKLPKEKLYKIRGQREKYVKVHTDLYSHLKK